MNEQAQRLYEQLRNGLTIENPEGIFTRHQIDHATVSHWGNALTAYHNQCEAELERIQVTIHDPAERERAAEAINEYYAEKETTFGTDLDIAVMQLYRENGISVEDNSLSQEETVSYARTPTPQPLKDETYAEFLSRTRQATSDGQVVAEKGRVRLEETYEDYKTRKAKEEEGTEKEADKHTLEHKPTQQQIRKLTPGF